jgi:hypothetical protein
MMSILKNFPMEYNKRPIYSTILLRYTSGEINSSFMMWSKNYVRRRDVIINKFPLRVYSCRNTEINRPFSFWQTIPSHNMLCRYRGALTDEDWLQGKTGWLFHNPAHVELHHLLCMWPKFNSFYRTTKARIPWNYSNFYFYNQSVVTLHIYRNSMVIHDLITKNRSVKWRFSFFPVEETAHLRQNLRIISGLFTDMNDIQGYVSRG